MPDNLSTPSLINVLVISPRDLDLTHLNAIREEELYRFYFSPTTIGLDGFSNSLDILSYLDECRELIRVNQIHTIIATQDIPALIQTRLHQELDHLLVYNRSESIESSLLCLHKYYTRKYIDLSPIPFHAFDLESDERELFDVPVPFPWIIKPCTTACSAEIHKVHDFNEAAILLPQLKEKIIQNNQYLKPFFRTYCNVNQYPLLDKDILLIEQYIPSITRCCVDGCVYDGEILIWGISQVHSYPNRPESIADFIFPALIDEATQSVLEEEYVAVVERVIKYGFNRQFINVEFFVMENGEVELIEVNARLSPVTTRLYRECLKNGDPYEVLLRMSANERPAKPVWNGLYGVVFYVTTFLSGYTNEIIDFKKMESLSDIELRVEPGRYLSPDKEIGISLASFNSIGESYDAMHEEAEIIRDSLLLNNNRDKF
jgi:hypothetical protein